MSTTDPYHRPPGAGRGDMLVVLVILVVCVGLAALGSVLS